MSGCYGCADNELPCNEHPLGRPHSSEQVAQVAAVLREHVRDFPGIVGARPDRCTGCAWEGTDWRRGGDEHMDHQAEVIVETLFRGGDDRG